jgi:hypothetical protein
MVEGHLESQKENGCAARTDAAIGKTLKDAVEGVGDSVLVESCGYLDAMLRRRPFCLRRNAASVEVTEGRAPDGGRLAGESAGHDVTAGCVHELSLSGDTPRTPATPGGFRQIAR